MARALGLDDVVDHFTLNSEETGWLRNKAGATRFGFAVQLKFLLWRGRFPKMRLELPRDAVEHVARQVDVGSGELAAYDFNSRTAQRHRIELRELTGWHECTRTAMVKLTSWLVDEIWHDERREEPIRAELLKQMRIGLIEPPTADQVTTIVRSALHQAEERAVEEVAARLARTGGCTRRLDALVSTDAVDDQDDEPGDEEVEDVEAVLSQIKAHPGNVSLNSPLDEIAKLRQVRTLAVPADAFARIGPQVIDAWRARAAASSPSHLRRFGPKVRHVLLAALVFRRKRETTDILVELLNSTVHRDQHPCGEESHGALRRRVHPGPRQVRTAWKDRRRLPRPPRRHRARRGLPAAGGEKTLWDLVAELKATNAEFARSKREVFRSSYSNHYRRSLMDLLGVLEFRSSNDRHSIDALKLIEGNRDSSTSYLPLDETIPLEGVVRKDWRELALHTPDKGPQQVIRTGYEARVFQALQGDLGSRSRPLAQS